jgi:hypothetical protein
MESGRFCIPVKTRAMKKMQSVLFLSFVLIQMLACNRNSKTFEMELARTMAIDSVAVADQPESTLLNTVPATAK